jgi:hypothetical protein
LDIVYNLVGSSSQELSAEEVALGYKQLIDVEHGSRTMKRPWTCGQSIIAGTTAFPLMQQQRPHML